MKCALHTFVLHIAIDSESKEKKKVKVKNEMRKLEVRLRGI